MGTVKLFLDALFPEGVVCNSCGREAVVYEHGLCMECCFGVEHFVTAPKLKDVDRFTAAFVYNDVASRMVKRLKYNGARFLAKPLADAIEIPEDWIIDAVVPVPLHAKKLARRGYNQSELIAKRLCERNSLTLNTGLLKRTKRTSAQVGSSLSERSRNLRGAFEADEACKGLSILLVDDVRTTGATLSECAAALKSCGAAKVYAAAACYVKPYN